MPKVIATNKKAYFDYQLTDRFEAGINLVGKEIKAIREGKISLNGSYVKLFTNSSGLPEAYLLGGHFGEENTPESRTKKLLLHRKELNRLSRLTQAKKFQLVPIEIILKGGLAKLVFALGFHRKKEDKREILKKRTQEKELKKILKKTLPSQLGS